ncbi:hypothetical protein BIW11_06824 [Tropilaelaps mercedesae]|uniref:Uncharacterized protein n=1 Tax=Tropilaelaps mercedesae TaxID=418985 RepID=A0A1V9XWF5_9ACAR|nr:hypothetical protein BIW11_06824 [Tropilaelaps mercedesae]
MNPLPLLALVIGTTCAAPLLEQVAYSNHMAVATAQAVSNTKRNLDERTSTTYDLRTIIERYVRGDIGLFRSLQGLASMVNGKTEANDIVQSVKEIFGATTAMAYGLILVLKNFGVHAFTSFVNKILGRDHPTCTQSGVPQPLQ